MARDSNESRAMLLRARMAVRTATITRAEDRSRPFSSPPFRSRQGGILLHGFPPFVSLGLRRTKSTCISRAKCAGRSWSFPKHAGDCRAASDTPIVAPDGTPDLDAWMGRPSRNQTFSITETGGEVLSCSTDSFEQDTAAVLYQRKDVGQLQLGMPIALRGCLIENCAGSDSRGWFCLRKPASIFRSAHAASMRGGRAASGGRISGQHPRQKRKEPR